jgi:hypothetical protein
VELHFADITAMVGQHLVNRFQLSMARGLQEAAAAAAALGK